jgi:hypothetical protein
VPDIYADDNISWTDPYAGIEPWEPDLEDDDIRPAGGCAYCDATEVRELPEPFGGRPCCQECFIILITDKETECSGDD